MTRIRYNKVPAEPHMLVSRTNIILPNGVLIDIELNTENNSYKFFNVQNDEVVSGGTANSLLNLKKLVRSTLLELGVPLEKEVKNSKKQSKAA